METSVKVSDVHFHGDMDAFRSDLDRQTFGRGGGSGGGDSGGDSGGGGYRKALQTRIELGRSLYRQHISPFLRFDLYTIEPAYERTFITNRATNAASFVTVLLSILYACVTLNDFVHRPPELVERGSFDLTNDLQFPVPLVGIEVSYETPDGERHFVDPTNSDPYFRVQFEHGIIREQDRVPRVKTQIDQLIPCGARDDRWSRAVCYDSNHFDGLELQGDFALPRYEYLNMMVTRCVNVTRHNDDDDNDDNDENPKIRKEPFGNTCGPFEDAVEMIETGNVRIILFLRAQTFDPEMYHYDRRNHKLGRDHGIRTYDRSWRWFAKQDASIQHEVYLQPREIQFRNRFLSLFPGLFESDISLLDFSHIDTYDRPRGGNRDVHEEYMEWFVRLDRLASRAEVDYSLGSVLDVLALIGAFFSFLALTIGCLARRINRYMFHRKFNRELQRGTFYHGGGKDLPWDKMDLRLFDRNHVDDRGRIRISMNEVLHPTTVFGELRRMALLSHEKRENAALKIGQAWLRYAERNAENQKLKESMLRSVKAVENHRASIVAMMAKNGHEHETLSIEGCSTIGRPAPGRTTSATSAVSSASTPSSSRSLVSSHSHRTEDIC